VLTEVGNILLNACLGVFGDLLQVHVSFSVPRLHLEQLRELLHSLMIGKEGLQYALLVHATFRLRDSAVSGYLVLVLGVASLDQLMRAIEQLG
jgi:chemotaxis protein CheC